MKNLSLLFSLFFICFTFSPATFAEESLSKTDALVMAFESAGILPENFTEDCFTDIDDQTPEIKNIICTAKKKNIISQNSDKFYPNKNISFIGFVKIALKSHGFVDKNNCALRGVQWYAPFLDIALSHHIIEKIPQQGKISENISPAEAITLLQKAKAKKERLNTCIEHPKKVSQLSNFRSDAGNYGNNSIGKIPGGAEVLAVGNPVVGKKLWYDNKTQEHWQAIIYDGQMGFVLASFVSDDIVGGKFTEKINNSFTILETEGDRKNPCKNVFTQAIKKYQVKGERTVFTGGILVYKKNNPVQFIRSELLNAYQQSGGVCGKLGYPLDPASRFGESPEELKKSFLSVYPDGTQKSRTGFQSSKIGWSQKFSGGKTLYTPNQSDEFYLFDTSLSNCVYDLSQSQLCCESPRGKACHFAVSGGGSAYNGYYRTNNSDWEWHHTALDEKVDLAGPTPRGEYNIQYRGGACKFKSPYMHWTCVSYLIHKGSSSRIHPPAGAKKPDGRAADFREELFIHPDFYSAGCVTFGEYLQGGNANTWEKQAPKWKKLTEILDGGKIYGRGYAGGGFIGKLVVTD
jgi:hypothetical protein